MKGGPKVCRAVRGWKICASRYGYWAERLGAHNAGSTVLVQWPALIIACALPNPPPPRHHHHPHTPAQIAFCATTSEPLKDIRHWLQWNRAIGVSRFYLFVQGRAGTAANVAALGREPGVTVVPDDEELRAAHASSRIWNETWLSSFFHKPCNHELFVLQSLNMERAIQLAQRDGVDWLLHIDTDELVHPGGTRHFSLQEVLAAVAPEVDVLVFPNHESLPERADVRDPFLEVTLFKRNYQHVQGELYSRNYAAVAHGNPNYFITYANGKAAARVQPGLRPNGAHRWNNYAKAVREETSAATGVLHYTYNRLSDLKNRRDRCDCAPTEEDAKRCFILPFDRLAFLRASLLDDDGLARFFADHLLWNDTKLVNDLINKGLFMRMHEPQIMIRGFMAAAGGEEAEAEEEEEGEAHAAPTRLEGVAAPLARLRPAFDGAVNASTPPSPSPSPIAPPQDRPPNPFVTLLQQPPPASPTEPAAQATGGAAVALPPPGPLVVTA